MSEPPNILTPLQAQFLSAFFNTPVGQAFYLTGGTALAAYYLQHRFSEDIDLFTTDERAFNLVTLEMEGIAVACNCALSTAVRGSSFQELLLQGQSEILRVDLVRDIDIQLGSHQKFGPVIVDAEENIGVNKVTAIFGRTESKDFVDLYFLIQKGYDFRYLVSKAKEKDTGLTEFYLANMMRQVRRLTRLPRMLKPLDLETLKGFYLQLADDLLRDIKPE